MLLPFLVTLARAEPHDPVIASLAPGPSELEEAQTELEERLRIAEATSRAVARLQGAASAKLGVGCSDPDQAELLNRLRIFADAWHDAVQRTRVQADRLATTANAPTVALIVDDERREIIGDRLARSDLQVEAWLELVAWFRRVSPRACDPTPLLAVPGFPPPSLLAAGEERSPAVVLVPTGFLCQVGKAPQPGGGRLFLVDGPACWSVGAECSCEPGEIYPAAVLGP
ncbi:MAG: hypothetical protein H6738_01115 [Alphaproteobacteria bacterium]|nr:hypothetical protein [Alphaproteobacteria bacterium]MCB9695367.1 hypothetical protein [Alphaproteobacteria bacterium]